eukprot:SAG22_NODE_373_length_11549_cov_12.592052_9_plen_100_part_00
MSASGSLLRSQRGRALSAYRQIWKAAAGMSNTERVDFVRLKLRTGYEENRELAGHAVELELQLAELQLDNVRCQAEHLTRLAEEEAGGRGKFNPINLPG